MFFMIMVGGGLSLCMPRSMFLTLPFQPLPPSTPPVNLNLTFLSLISFATNFVNSPLTASIASLCSHIGLFYFT